MGRWSWSSRWALKYNHVFLISEAEGALTWKRIRSRGDRAGGGWRDAPAHEDARVATPNAERAKTARPGKEGGPAHTLTSSSGADLGLLDCRTVRECISVVRGHLDCGTLL